METKVSDLEKLEELILEYRKEKEQKKKRILYLNLMTMGYNFGNYVNFIIREPECYYSIIGLTIMILSITIKGEKDI